MAMAKSVRRRGRRPGAFAVLGLLAVLAACDDDAPVGIQDPVAVSNVRIVPAAIVLNEMQSVLLEAVVTDRSGSPIASAVEWSVSDSTLAKVGADGTFTGLRGGLVMVQARAAGHTGQAHVHVEEVAYAIDFGVESLDVPRTATRTLDAHVICKAGHTVDRTIDWSVSDPSIALVNQDGGITGIMPGEVIVSARSGGLSASVPIRVTDPVVRIVLELPVARIRIGESIEARASAIGSVAGSAGATVTWASSDPAVASVSAVGVVTGHSRGTALLTAAAGAVSASARITVDPAVTGIALSAPNDGFVVIGHPMQIELEIVVSPGAAASAAVWESSDPAIATVDQDGIVRGEKSGAVVISATIADRTDSIGLVVEPEAATFVIEPSNQTLPLGMQSTLIASATDAGGAPLHRAVTWTSSDPDIVGVNNAGGITAWRAGSAVITATALDIARSILVRVEPYVASLTIQASADVLRIGDTVTLIAFGKDGLGRATAQTVTWNTSDPRVIEVTSTGVGTARGQGAAVVSATTAGVTASMPITVLQTGAPGPLHGISVSPPTFSGHVGGSTTITATGRDQAGNVVPASFVWTSLDPSIAMVDQNGLVTGVAEGSTEIIVSSGTVSASVPVQISQSGGGGGGSGGGGGGGEPEFGNNLSNPVVFADGLGVTGLAVSTDPGLRPTANEGIAVTGTSAFWYSGNKADWQGTYYTQQSENTWRAEWMDGTGTMQDAAVDWGDNILSHTFNTHSPIRIEVVLYSASVGPLTGFNTTSLSGTGSTEVQGTDGTTGLFTPTVYSVVPRLTIQKVDSVTMQPIPGAIGFDGTIADGLAAHGPGSFSAEVNVAGKVIYGFGFLIQDITLPANLHKYGWWRITFSLDGSATMGGSTTSRNTRLVSLMDVPGLYTPVLDPSGTSSYIDIYVDKAQGGGGSHVTGSGSDH